MIALVACAQFDPWSSADPGSALSLEPLASADPFHEDELLQIDEGNSDPKIVTVLDLGIWPWVLVRLEGPKTSEAWINFVQAHMIRRVDAFSLTGLHSR
jgi:hypothetical protein